MRNPICDMKISFYAGTSIEDATSAVYDMVHKLKIPLSFDFNGLTIWIEPKDDCSCPESEKG